MSTEKSTRELLAESEILARLADLPAPDLEPGASERAHRRARAAFVRHAGYKRYPWLERLVRWYGYAEPVMAGAVAASYLFWGVTSAAALFS